jgi:hypothetical protein
MNNPFDAACRYLLRLNAVALLAWFLGLRESAFAFAGWLDARRVHWPGQPERVCDTVAHLKEQAAHGLPWAVPVEFQIEPDPDMTGRLLVYLGGVLLELRPSDLPGDRFQVGAVVVNLRGEGNASRRMAWRGSRLLTHLGVVERNLSGMSAKGLLGL